MDFDGGDHHGESRVTVELALCASCERHLRQESLEYPVHRQELFGCEQERRLRSFAKRREDDFNLGGDRWWLGPGGDDVGIEGCQFLLEGLDGL
jgi:hypothetical protein